MNRKKKINAALKSAQKRANAKLQNSNKPRYVSKAERALLEEQDLVNQVTDEQELTE
jgi:hypothetical protein